MAVFANSPSYHSLVNTTSSPTRCDKMTHAEIRIAHRRKPRLECWNLATVTSALRMFQSIGSMSALILIGGVGSHFSATYAVLAISTLAAIASITFVIAFLFSLHIVTTSIDWKFWESLYSGSFAFLFFINVIVMTYSSIRWEYTAWWLGTVVCSLVGLAFLIDLIVLVRRQLTIPSTRHSTVDVQRRLPTTDIY